MKRLSYVSAATAARLLFGAVLSFAVLARVDHPVAVEIFQFLLFQSALIALISGGAYPRGVALSGDLNRGTSMLIAFVLLCAVLSGLILVGAAIAHQHSGWLKSIPDDTVVLSFLLGGAVLTGLHTLLQGLFLHEAGPAKSFLSVIISQIVAGLILFIAPLQSTYAILSLYAVSQALPLVLYIMFNRELLRRLPLRESLQSATEIFAYLREVLMFGATSALYLVVLLAVRQWWADHVEASTAVYVFFAMRISEIYMQVAYYMYSSAQSSCLPNGSGPTGLLDRRPFASYSILFLIGIVTVALAFALRDIVWIAVLAVAAQIAVDLLRLPVSSITIAAIRAGRPGLYLAMIAPALAALIATVAIATRFDPATALFYGLAAYAYVIVLSSLVLRDKRDSTSTFSHRHH